MARNGGLLQVLALASIATSGQSQEINPAHHFVQPSDAADTLPECCLLHKKWETLAPSLPPGSADWEHVTTETGKWYGYQPCCM
eukprot:COSAG01_NODE_34506_length_546_cov_1.474273_1_plen_83_part_10